MALGQAAILAVRGQQRLWTLLDADPPRGLDCAAPLDELAVLGPTPLPLGPAVAGGRPPLCLPHRIDHAAPQSHPRDVPPAVCVLWRYLRLTAAAGAAAADGGRACT